MYHHPGEYVTDFCLVKRDSHYHLFHIRGERWTWPLGYREIDLGHAISTDMRNWTPLEAVVPAGLAGTWDACGIWAPDIIEVDGVYYLYYTGTDTNNNQKIGLATSSDLLAWSKYAGNPVVEPGAIHDHVIRVKIEPSRLRGARSTEFEIVLTAQDNEELRVSEESRYVGP